MKCQRHLEESREEGESRLNMAAEGAWSGDERGCGGGTRDEDKEGGIERQRQRQREQQKLHGYDD